MSTRFLWLALVLLTTTWTTAQTPRWTPLTEPVVVAGNDLGFQIEWMNGRIPMGKIVVRLNGQWVEARVGTPPGLIPSPPPPPPPR